MGFEFVASPAYFGSTAGKCSSQKSGGGSGGRQSRGATPASSRAASRANSPTRRFSLINVNNKEFLLPVHRN